ncbi:uncharacterized protein LOC133125087 [Conger conger]|uniref:uncharacterized protein LOC133125087 n=1 Tax=Conger conger TaxID=82655 RepID=UPI002A59B68B|nr:uncharacterized protein LOC133125087 [Conger conger]
MTPRWNRGSSEALGKGAAGLGAPVKCTMAHGTEIDVRMDASLNAASLLYNTEILFMDRGGEYVSAICTATSCRSPEGEISAQYYGALGQSAYVHLRNTSVDHSGFELQVFFKCEDIFTYRQRNKKTNFHSGRNGLLLKNGTLRLDNLTKNHSGVYSIEEFSNGRSTGTRKITLTIQAPVSPPELSQLCQPHGEMRAWCSSTGEAPQYSWTLNDRPLDGGVAFLSNETQTVILKRDIPGSITCIVSNHVSKESTTQKLLTCPASV